MGDRFKVYIIIKLNILCVDPENFFTAFYIRLFNRNLTVKAAWAQKGRVKDVCTVCSCKDDEAFFIVETIHFNKKLVECLFALVIASAKIVYTAFTDGVNFIDEDDAWSLFPCVAEKIADTAGTNAYKHFNKVRTGNPEERNTGFTCNCTGKQSLTCSRRSNKEDSLWNFSADFRIFLWFLKEVNDFNKFVLCFINTGNVAETCLYFAFIDCL